MNLRADDINYNPVFFSYAIFDKVSDSVDLFSDKEHFNPLLALENVKIHEYEGITAALQDLCKAGTKIGVDKNKVNAELDLIIKDNCVSMENVVESIKACKTKIEQDGMQAANVRDCAAIIKYFAFLEQELKKPDHGLNEYTGARKVEAFRAEHELYMGPSFDTISSIGANGAVIHYKPEKETAMKLNNDEIYLLDSGGQYKDGTTDITRTAHFGGKAPTAF